MASRADLAERLRLLESVVGHAKDAVVLTDFDENDEPRIVFVNDAFTDQTGYSPAEVIGHHPRMLVGPESDYAAQVKLRDAVASRAPTTVELSHYRKDGSVFVVENAINPIFDDAGRCTHLVSIQRDVTERKAAEEALRRSDRRFRRIIEQASDVITILDTDGEITYWSPAAARLVGYPADASPQAILDLIRGDDYELVADAVRRGLRSPGSREIVAFRIAHLDGTVRHLEAVVNNLVDDPDVNGVVIITRDITERVEAAEELEFRAMHDGLTQLPNRTLLVDRLNQALHHDGLVGLLMMDLDRFKAVNDTLGHSFGDNLLRQVAIRLLKVVPASDTVARLGGDEFAILLPDLDEPAHAEAVAAKVLATLRPPFDVRGITIPVDASIGIALAPIHGTDGSTLMQRADLAMYRAKGHVTGFAVYDNDPDDQRLSGLALMVELRRAIERNQLVLHYQPVVDIETRQVVTVEALVRWRSPTRGWVPPDEFIPLAEETGVIRPLTDWMIEAALAQAKRWRSAGWPVRVSINVSGRLVADRELPDRIEAALRRTGVSADAIQIEVTESAVMLNPDWALAVFNRLADLGVRLTIDDFGTGYSSFTYLKDLPAHQVKIDKSFVLEMVSDDKDASIVKAVIDLGHNLGLSVVAEGVEDDATLFRLADWGCDYAQGFLLGRPAPASAYVDRGCH